MTQPFRFRGDDGLRLSITRRQRDTMEDTATTTTPATIQDRVKKIIIDMLEVEPEKVTADADFIDKLGADSLDYVELTMTCEEEFDIEIADDAAEHIKTVGDLVRYITEKTAAA